MLRVSLKRFMKSWGDKYMAYNNKTPFFFSSTQSLDDELGRTLNFIWANYVSLREMWWQVRGYKNSFPTQTVKELNNKFLSGLPSPGGIDLKDICVNTEWNEHENEFCKWLLFDCCTLYEGWIENICDQVFEGRNVKDLQFPTDTSNQKGYMVAMNAVNSHKSQLIENEFYPNLLNNKLNRLTNINEYLIAYRYFKECRNTFIHSNGRVTHKVIDTYSALSTLQQNNSPFSHNFSLHTPILGEKIKLNLNDCKLFAFAIRNLVATFDAELSKHIKSEEILENRIKKLISTANKWKNVTTNPAKRLNTIHRILVAAKIPEPNNISNIKIWMEVKSLI